MKFKATDDQIGQLMAHAVNASAPNGMGVLSYQNREYSKEELLAQYPATDNINIDYHDGRMVKLHLYRLKEDTWDITDTISPEYQSWCSTYHGPIDLLHSVEGIRLAP